MKDKKSYTGNDHIAANVGSDSEGTIAVGKEIDQTIINNPTTTINVGSSLLLALSAIAIVVLVIAILPLRSLINSQPTVTSTSGETVALSNQNSALTSDTEPSPPQLTPAVGEVKNDQTSKMELAWIAIPAGEFMYGADEYGLERAIEDCDKLSLHCEEGWFDQELEGADFVFLDEFEINQYEISNFQYTQCVNEGVCESANQDIAGDIPKKSLYFKGHYPVVGVTYTDAVNFCEWIGGRIPTEKEWEKAAKGTERTIYPWGNEFHSSMANVSVNETPNFELMGPQRIQSYESAASPYGVVNMAGNVFEWTSSKRKGKRILRGGSWFQPFYRSRVTDRGTNLPDDYASYDIGFRCVRE